MRADLIHLLRSFLILAFTVAIAEPAAAQALPRLKVSDNRRFLVTADGQPFFWLGDTAWELFHRPTREDADRYLAERARRSGFTVIQAVALAEFDGLHEPNAYGAAPRSSTTIRRSRTKTTSRHVDWIVAKANALGLYVGFLPTWGDKWNKKWGIGPEIFTPTNARGLRRVARAPLPETPDSSGFSAAIGRSRTTPTATSSAPWPVACARATAART